MGVDHVWKQLLAGRSGISAITSFDVSDMGTRIAGQVPRGSAVGEFDPATFFDHQEQRRLESFLMYGIAATVEAIRDAGWEKPSNEECERTGVLVGSGIGGVERIAETALTLRDRGPKRVSPFFIPMSLINEAAGLVSMRFGYKGPVHSVVTACATGANAIGDSTRIIQFGDADVMIAGGTEAATGRVAMAGFSAMRALSTEYNDRPTEASRPWDKSRDGFVLGEGAGIMVLEEREHALKRGARIYAEVTGYGVTGDAYHMSAPEPEGDGAYRAMKAAMGHAKLTPDQVGYVNAHATSTPVGDPVELKALRRLLGSHAGAVSISSTKSSIGHLLGAAGAVEAIFSVLALRDQVAPATLNLRDPEGAEGLDLVPLEAKPRVINHSLSNSFGFGGTNAALVFSRPS